jgi:hypothetical protein
MVKPLRSRYPRGARPWMLTQRGEIVNVKEPQWAEPCVGYVVRHDLDRCGRDRFTVFRRQNGLWELFDARYRTYDEAVARASRDRRSRGVRSP